MFLISTVALGLEELVVVLMSPFSDVPFGSGMVGFATEGIGEADGEEELVEPPRLLARLLFDRVFSSCFFSIRACF